MGDQGDRFEVPLRLGRGQNDRENRFARADRIRKERAAISLLWPRSWKDRAWSWPLEVVLTRVKPSGELLDDDNLVASLKAVRDEVAKQLGVDDGDRERIRFRCAEDRGPWAVRVEVREGPFVRDAGTTRTRGEGE